MNEQKAIKYLNLARFMAETFSKDPNTKVGCILLNPTSYNILSMGYNGFPRGINEKAERWQRPTKYNFVCHAELNALTNACRSGVCTENSIAIITMYPCCTCCKSLIQSGIKTIITVRPNYQNNQWGEEFKVSKIMLEEAKIDTVFLD